MNQDFDFFSQPELPYIILANPDLTQLYSLSLAYNTKLTRRFNALSEFSFTFPKSIDGGITAIEAYEYIKNKRLVLIEGYGYFQIVNATEDLNGSTPTIDVECTSLESELIQKKVTSYGGTQKLWDILDSEGTILQDMINLAPNWSVGDISPSLLTKFRTFDISDSTIYQFLTVDVAGAFEAIFIFDTLAKTISVYDLSEATTVTDIFLSFDNVISKANMSEKSDEITTCLAVYGAGNLNIRQVNPLGSDKIYDFSYYKNLSWMSSGLVDAITAWEILLAGVQTNYANNLGFLSTYNAELLALQSTLATLNADLLSLEGVKAVRIQAGSSLTLINIEITAKQAEIASQNLLITNKQSQITSTTAILQAISDSVSFEENFTPSQLLELNNFIYENTYKNENILQTDSMTAVQVQATAQSLYEQGQSVLSRISQPRYEFELESVNYIVLEEFEVFTQQTDVGSIVTSELKDGTYIESVILEIELQFDDPSNFSMKLSNRLRLDNGDFTYSDLMGQVQKTGASVSFDSVKWGNWANNYQDEVTTFINSALDATVNNLISNSNQEIIIDQNGLRGRSWDTTLGAFKQKQVWLTNNVLAFSDDGFTTAKLALGEIALPGGGKGYGLVAGVIVGNLLAGNSLSITNEGNNFVLDQTGATLTNAKFSIQTTNSKILLDPTNTRAFRIQKNEGGTFNDKFWVDNAGNVNFSGSLTGATGTFSGTLSATVGNIGTLVIDANGLKTPDGVNYLRGNGDLKWGGLSISGGVATFNGNIFADKLIGAVSYSQLTDIPANKITSGTMSGGRIFGGTATVGQLNLGVASIYNVGSNLEMITNGSISISSAAGGAVSAGSGVTISGSSLNIYSTTNFQGGITINGFTGLTTTRTISTPAGTRTVTFRNGILTGFT